jgi:hypothetical protein
MASEEENQPGDDENKPPGETILEQQRDPEEAAFAEQAIQEYAQWVLDAFRQNVESAFDGYSAWVMSQDPAVFNNAALFETVARESMKFMGELCGHAGTPVGQVLMQEVGAVVDAAVRQENEASLFVNELSRAARDASWYLRDNLQSVLSNHWDSLLDLAYEGSTDFVAVIHQLGLPVAEWSPPDMTQRLQQASDGYAKAVPQQQEEAVADEGAKSEEQEQAAEESKQEFQEEAEEKVA